MDRVSILLIGFVLLLITLAPDAAAQKRGKPVREPDSKYDKNGKGEKITTKIEEKDGSETIEVEYKDADGHTREVETTTTKKNGDTEKVTVKKEANGDLISRDEESEALGGKWKRTLHEQYKNNKVVSGTLDEDFNGLPKKHKEYNPKTEQYEEGTPGTSDPVPPWNPPPLPTFPDITLGPGKKLPCNVAMQPVGLAAASTAIGKMISYIDEKERATEKAYYYEGASKTLRAAFAEAGVGFSMRYADDWGKGGIGLAFSGSARPFYVENVRALRAAYDSFQKRGHATRGEIAELENGLAKWDAVETDIEHALLGLTRAYVAEAKVLDEKDAAYRRYQANLSRLQGIKPYPSAQVDQLNQTWYRDERAFEDRVNLILNGAVAEFENELKAAGEKRLFPSRTTAPSC